MVKISKCDFIDSTYGGSALIPAIKMALMLTNGLSQSVFHVRMFWPVHVMVACIP